MLVKINNDEYIRADQITYVYRGGEVTTIFMRGDDEPLVAHFTDAEFEAFIDRVNNAIVRVANR